MSKPPTTAHRYEHLADVKTWHVGVFANTLTISIDLDTAYEAQTLMDDIEGLWKSGHSITLAPNRKRK